MFARAASIFVLALPLLAAATALPRNEPGNQCDSGSLQCCTSTDTVSQAENDPILLALLVSLGINVNLLTDLIGVTCTAGDFIGIGITNCNQQAVCCTDNNFGGLVSLGCNEFNV